MRASVVGVGLVAVAAMAAPVFACGVPDFGGLGAALAEAFNSDHEDIVRPDIALGGSSTSLSVDAGLAWGDKSTGFLAGIDLSRVMFEVHREDDRSRVALT